MPAKYVLGIDLGTTNSVVAYAPITSGAPKINLLPIPQLTAPGLVESRTTLPSFLYLPGAHEAGASLSIPGLPAVNYVVGELARRQSAENAQRTVAAAKSWLCYSRVDRHQPILPWNAPEEVPKVSPVEATRRYLAHLAAAWQAAFPDDPLADQEVVLTVPASFDASARELTREAAFAAGLPASLVLLEEPQAAVYSWLADMGDKWRKKLKLHDRLLICDVGGGTTDFTLIAVAEQHGELYLERVAVGNHVLVGGDNMDLAVAHHAATAFAEQQIKLDPWQSVSLWHACRAAKEALLNPDGPATFPVTVLGRGSRLIGKSVSVELPREAIQSLLAEGFFPGCMRDDKPSRRRQSGFQEIGLPFDSDTGITRHLAAFLAAHGEDGKPTAPTHVLFNGGVFKAQLFRKKLLQVIGSWLHGQKEPTELPSQDEGLDHAVARGAAYYGLAKHGRGVRIRGGTARSYYVGIETAGLAVPGAPRPLQALCVVPFGMEEGTTIDVPGGETGLVVGEPAHFRFFSSAVRKADTPGVRLPQLDPVEIEETDSLETTLEKAPDSVDDFVPVHFRSNITELGVLELWCVSTQNEGQQWKLEFSVRDDAE